MKLLVTIFLIMPMFVCIGQQHSLMGDYQVNLEKSVALMESNVRLRYDSLPDHIKSQANGSMTGRIFSFKPNGQVNIQWKVNEADKKADGTWQLNSERNKLLIVAQGMQVEYQVEWALNDGLILRNSKDFGLFNNLYLEKTD